MAENQQPAEFSSPKESQLLVSSGSSSSELSTSGSSDLRPSSLGRISSNSLSSLTVPMRLDVLYLLLSSAAKGMQNPLVSPPVHGGSVSSCPGPVAPQSVKCCCNCHPPLPHAPGAFPYTHWPSEPHQDRTACASYGPHGRWNPGIPGHQSTNYSMAQRRDAKTWSGTTTQPDSSRGWRNPQSSLGWKENQRGPAGRYRKEDNWRQKQAEFRKPWEDQRRSMGESTPWNLGKRKSEEPPSLGAHSANSRNQGERGQASWGGPEDQRHPSHTWMGSQKTKETPEGDNISNKIAAKELTKTALQDDGEDWETEYNQGTVDVLEGKQATSPLPKSGLADPAVATTEEEPTKSPLDWSKNGDFIRYLKSRYTDVPPKSSSESSTDLVIDTEEEKEEEKVPAKSN